MVPENFGPISGGLALPPSLSGVLGWGPLPGGEGTGRRTPDSFSPPGQSPNPDLNVYLSQMGRGDDTGGTTLRALPAHSVNLESKVLAQATFSHSRRGLKEEGLKSPQEHK